jgi:hypothetical protein
MRLEDAACVRERIEVVVDVMASSFRSLTVPIRADTKHFQKFGEGVEDGRVRGGSYHQGAQCAADDTDYTVRHP